MSLEVCNGIYNSGEREHERKILETDVRVRLSMKVEMI